MKKIMRITSGFFAIIMLLASCGSGVNYQDEYVAAQKSADIVVDSMFVKGIDYQNNYKVLGGEKKVEESYDAYWETVPLLEGDLQPITLVNTNLLDDTVSIQDTYSPEELKTFYKQSYIDSFKAYENYDIKSVEMYGNKKDGLYAEVTVSVEPMYNFIPHVRAMIQTFTQLTQMQIVDVFNSTARQNYSTEVNGLLDSAVLLGGAMTAYSEYIDYYFVEENNGKFMLEEITDLKPDFSDEAVEFTFTLKKEGNEYVLQDDYADLFTGIKYPSEKPTNNAHISDKLPANIEKLEA